MCLSQMKMLKKIIQHCAKMVHLFGLGLCFSVLYLPALSAQQTSYNETQLISKAEQSLSALTTVQAAFVQISSDGSVGEGVLYLRRPVQLRLEYKNPETLTLITSSVWLYVDDKIAKSVQALPIGQTPLAPLLQKEISFRSNDFKTSARTKDGIAIITLSKEEGEGAGTLALEFDEASWQLRKWVITDVLGIRTSVTLQNPVYGIELANSLFGVPGYDNQNSN